MTKKKMTTIDGNTAAAHIAYAFSEVAAIYPITPSSNMGELADAWAAQGRKNIFDRELSVIEMQSEAGAAGAVHGALSGGALTTTFTASQGLLLMIPNMHKIAGEMLPTVFHVSARSLAAQSLSIFGDHSDVMSCRNTGFAMLASGSIQEVLDLATVAHLTSPQADIPFLHFFDGFRTSHEVQKVESIDYDTLKGLFDFDQVARFRDRAMRPDKPVVKVAAQNPDVYFQGRETVNKYYQNLPELVQKNMDRVGEVTGRKYKLFDYCGAPDAEKIIVLMGSAVETAEETVDYLVNKGEKVGVLKVRLFRPFSIIHFLEVLPSTVKQIAALDRTKEPGSQGEPLYMDVKSALSGSDVQVIGGRYGLSSKEFTPSMVNAVYKHLDGAAFHGFTVGIKDDVTNYSLPIKENIDTEDKDVVRCMFWGLGSDGTVGANKDSIKIIGDNTDMYAQGYFVYDSKKSGGITISHLRFGPRPISSPYLVTTADFVACHNPSYIGRFDMLSCLKPGGVFLLNSEWDNDEVFNKLTPQMQQRIIEGNIRFYNINALEISARAGLGRRINTVMQAAFFKISGILPEDQAMSLIKDAIKKRFSKKGEDIVKQNWQCVDDAAAALHEVQVPKSMSEVKESHNPAPLIGEDASEFAKNIILPSMHREGDVIPVSQMTYDGTLPTGTTALEKRGIAPRVPHWESDNCIQCNICSMACPHAVIRPKQIDPADLENAPATFNTLKSMTKNNRDLRYKIQVYCEDCVGCGVCIEVCPGKKGNKALVYRPIEEERENGENENSKFFESLPDNVLDGVKENTVKWSQFKKPLFEFSGACPGCGETSYIKLVTQLFGDRMIAANATGCSSIYGGTFPTVPYCKNKEGRGPSWGNSLFEDNAEYGFGMRLAVDNNRSQLKITAGQIMEESAVGEDLKKALDNCMSHWDETGSDALSAQDSLKKVLAQYRNGKDGGSGIDSSLLDRLAELQDYFVDKSIWIIGGDGWAYDIGFGGLDHVIASGRNVNLLVLDTEVYSNTGGQSSKATPLAAVAQFAAAGKRSGKKNLGVMAMTYGNVYVASISMGANRNQTLKAVLEAESYPGPSLIMAYSPCIAHGIDMSRSQEEEKLAVDSGYWPLYRYNPDVPEGEKRFVWESKDPSFDFQEFLQRQRRYTSLRATAGEEAEELWKKAGEDAVRRMDFMKKFGDIV